MAASGGPDGLVSATALAAAASGGRRRPALLDRAASTQAIEAFLQAVGGRAALLEALEIGAQQAEVDQVLDLLADPRYARLSLRQICHMAGLSVTELLTAFRSATLLRAQILATKTVADGLVAVVTDVMQRAAPYDETCPICDGTGTYTPRATKKTPDPIPEPCKACKATGVQRVVPELERQKVALELADLLKKGGGIGITLTQQTAVQTSAGGSRSGALERLQQVVGGALSGSLPILDLTPVASSPPEPSAAGTPSQAEAAGA